MDLEKPLPSDCCGSGCTPCVFDIYEDHLVQSKKENKKTSNSCGEHLLRVDLLSKTRFKPFRLIEKLKLSEDVFLVRFQAVEKTITEQNKISDISGILPYSIGQHLFLRCCLNQSFDKDVQKSNKPLSEKTETVSNNKLVIRAYTPITIAALEQNCCFNVFFKFYKNGTASTILYQSLLGDILYWRGPYGTLNLNLQSFDYILMTCIGTGLAPMVPLVNSVLNNEFDETLIHLMYGVKNMNNIILRDELRRMTHFWNFTLEYFLSQPTELKDSAKFGEIIKVKKIDIISIKECIVGKKLENILVLVCGTESFSLDIKNVLQVLGFDLNKNVHIFS